MPLAARLREPRCFPHPVHDIERVETHISWVVLAGDYAYKLKKPLDLGFLDFSTLEKRRAACEDELRLNRRTAPELYLDVVAITGTQEEPRIGGDGPVLDYAVRMRRFDRALEFDRLLLADKLLPEHIDELSRLVARFHATVPAAAPSDACGTPEMALANANDNFAHVLALAHAPDIAARLAALRQWTLDTQLRIAPLMRLRQREGFVRECHGDLHLANIVLHEGAVVVFDCIEFNPAMRWIDVMAEIAFTVMDLNHRARPDLAQRFLNGYLEATGDYAGLGVLRFYLVYRAMVRAKIAAIRATQSNDAATSARDHADFRAHLDLAVEFTRADPPAMLITCGPSGSGKSYLAALLAGTGEWIRVRSDVERKRLSGLAAGERSASAPGAGLYATTMNERTYARLAELAATVVEAGYPVIIDATFLERKQRCAFRKLAASLGIGFAILAPQVPVELMRERVQTRAARGADTSEATVAVLERQLEFAQALDADENAATVRIDTSGDIDVEALAVGVAARLAESGAGSESSTIR
ncbi:MAG: AAA family ATPase [Burkholderiales bacterium]|nr:AAA family ATPase [Burkholderiales bacterium]